MRVKLLGGVVAVAVMMVPASAQAFTVWSQNFETVGSGKPANNLTSTSLIGGTSWVRSCVGNPAHTGSCSVGAGDLGGGVTSLPTNVSDTVLTQTASTRGRGAGNNVQLRFWRYTALGDTTGDGVVLETSVNGGPWADFLTRPGAGVVQGGYNTTISGATGSPIAGRQAWSGNTLGYVRSVVNLARLAQKDSRLRFRFRLATDNTTSSNGVRIDDILETASDGAYSPAVQPADGKRG